MQKPATLTTTAATPLMKPSIPTILPYINESELLGRWKFAWESDENNKLNKQDPITAHSIIMEFYKDNTGKRYLIDSGFGSSYSTDFKWSINYDKGFGNILIMELLSD